MRGTDCEVWGLSVGPNGGLCDEPLSRLLTDVAYRRRHIAIELVVLRAEGEVYAFAHFPYYHWAETSAGTELGSRDGTTQPQG